MLGWIGIPAVTGTGSTNKAFVPETVFSRSGAPPAPCPPTWPTAGYRVTGLDRSSNMNRRARHDHPHLDLSVGDATLLPYDNNAFDAVVAASVINVVADAEAVLSEMHRVCAPAGTVSVLVPSTDFTDEDLDALIETRGLTGFSQAALTKWHRSAPKTSRSHLETLFRKVELEPAITHSYLDGMLIAATAPARSRSTRVRFPT